MKNLFVLVLMLTVISVGAQYYINDYSAAHHNPQFLNNDGEFAYGGGLDPAWVPFLGPSATPSWSGAQNIPFAFDFNGNPETQFMVSNSGVLTFDVSTAVAPPSFTAGALPSSGVPDKSVCVWGIRGTGSNDYVCQKTFGTAPARQQWIFFASYSTATVGEYTYFAIVLEETSDNIYICDMRNNSTLNNLALGVQINSSTAIALNGGNNSYVPVAQLDASPDDNGYYEFIPGARPANDMACVGTQMVSYVARSQAPFNVVADFRNFGAAIVTSYDMNYSVNNGPVYSGNIPTVGIVTQAGTSASHPTTWTPPAAGQYSFKVWASNINGNTDAYNSNDTFSFVVNVADTMCPRTTLMEVFTSSTCIPCVSGNVNMESNVIPNIFNYTVIKYPEDLPGNGDPYANAESAGRMNYYGISNIPRMEIDGQWNLTADSLTPTVFTSYQQEAAFTEINISSAYYVGTDVYLQAQIKPLISYTGNHFRYYVAVVEKQTTGNVATNGETNFYNVMMNMFPTDTGTAIGSLSAFVPVNINATIPMMGTYTEDMNDLRVVIFVQDDSSQMVMQSAWLDVAPSAVQNTDVNGNGIARLYPNPANEIITMEYNVSGYQQVSWTMTNVIGEVVQEQNEENATAGTNSVSINTGELESGVYFLTLTMKDGVFTQRVVISH